MKNILTCLVLFFLVSCSNERKPAELMIFNAKIYTLDTLFRTADCMVIDSGKVVFTGTFAEASKKFTVKEKIDADAKFIYPGFIDAHCHFYGYGKGLGELQLEGTRSFEQVISTLLVYAREREMYPEKSEWRLNEIKWIIGRGWDQNDWQQKDFPTKAKIDSLFPNTPVLLKRVDGHAALVNRKALEIAGLDERTKIDGGELITQNGKLTGVLLDKAAEEVEKWIPPSSKQSIKDALLKAQESCLGFGITTVDDAGLEKSIVEEMDELQKAGQLKIRVYAMLTPSQENLAFFMKKGIYKTDKLNVRSFKFYGDGALGSRGACLKEDYADKKNWKGFLLNQITYYEKYAEEMAKAGFQMNTHCIGDSAVKLMLDIYVKHCKGKDRRWRIEHAQVVDETDIEKFEKGIIPSVQSTHATSDMYWAKDRLGKKRITDAYAYKKLLSKAGKLALGTDFPVEDVSPFKTFYSAVFRKDTKGFPEEGFQPENALTRQEALKGMTIWAAYANFEEKEKGSLDQGKLADFVILDTDLMHCQEKEILNTKVVATFIGGKLVYSSIGK